MTELGEGERPREPVGFWAPVGEPSGALPNPRDLVDRHWPLRERVRVAHYLRRGRPLVAYMGKSTCRFECGLPFSFMGSRDLGDERFVWPEALDHYVEMHAVRLPEAFLAHVAPRLPRLVPLVWWLGFAGRFARWRMRIVVGRWREARAARARERATTPLHEAVKDGDTRAVRRALAAGIGVDARDEYGLTPLCAARSREMAALLLEAGAEITPKPVAYATPIHEAVKSGDLGWLELVLSHGASVDAVDKAGRHPLDLANHVAMMRRLLAVGADPTKGAPLYWPAHSGDRERVEILLEAGADPNAAVNGMTVLMAAARGKDGDAVIARLLQAGADPGPRDSMGQTALIIAAGRNSVVAVRALLDAGADPRAITSQKITALHMSALGNDGKAGAAEVLALLLAAGAGPIDQRDWVGRTPLYLAVFGRNPAAARVLLEAGADASIANVEGSTPLALARAMKDDALVAILEAAREPANDAATGRLTPP